MKENAVIYARFSARPDAEKCESLEVQIDRCQQYATITNLDIIQVFKDPEISARKTALANRPDGRRMLEYISDHRVKHIVAARLDRMFRDSRDGMNTISDLDRDGVSVHFSDQGGVSLCANTAVGRLVFTLLLGVASFEPAMTAERTSKALRYKQRNGYRVSGNAPFGFAVDPANPKQLVRVNDEQESIALIMELRQKMTIPEIVKQLNHWGYTMRAERWRSRSVGKIIEREMERSLYGHDVQTGAEVVPRQGARTASDTTGAVNSRRSAKV